MYLYWRMSSLKVTDIIKAHDICFLKTGQDDCGHCTICPMFDYKVEEGETCQQALAKITIMKLTQMKELLDNTVNHHYYDTLEQYQELSSELQSKLDAIEQILTKSQQ